MSSTNPQELICIFSTTRECDMLVIHWHLS